MLSLPMDVQRRDRHHHHHGHHLDHRRDHHRHHHHCDRHLGHRRHHGHRLDQHHDHHRDQHHDHHHGHLLDHRRDQYHGNHDHGLPDSRHDARDHHDNPGLRHREGFANGNEEAIENEIWIDRHHDEVASDDDNLCHRNDHPDVEVIDVCHPADPVDDRRSGPHHDDGRYPVHRRDHHDVRPLRRVAVQHIQPSRRIDPTCLH
mmetsp:Transcript_20942/g.34605  ORF Transcript_20942/g.34605 Transcript_20942/m.34605 type:complete len:203 (+) Transcript_20942:116-724(+)